MYLQVTNTTKAKHNQIGTSRANLFKDVKAMGWDIKNCTVKEIAKELLSDKILKF